MEIDTLLFYILLVAKISFLIGLFGLLVTIALIMKKLPKVRKMQKGEDES
jgi:hypothetical protein